MTTTATDSAVWDSLLTKLDKLAIKLDAVADLAEEANRRIDRLFYLGAATGSGFIAALLLQPLIAAISS